MYQFNFVLQRKGKKWTRERAARATRSFSFHKSNCWFSCRSKSYIKRNSKLVIGKWYIWPICGPSLLLVLSLLQEVSPSTPVFPSPQKPALLNSNSTRNARTHNTWASGSGAWATTPRVIELKTTWFDFDFLVNKENVLLTPSITLKIAFCAFALAEKKR